MIIRLAIAIDMACIVRTFQKKKMLVTLRQEVIQELIDLAMFAVYIIILYIVIISNKDKMAVLNKNDLEEMLKGTHTRTISFLNILTVEE